MAESDTKAQSLLLDYYLWNMQADTDELSHAKIGIQKKESDSMPHLYCKKKKQWENP